MADEAAQHSTPAAVLADLRACDQAERAASAARLQLACAWADLHPAINDLPFASSTPQLIDDGPGVALQAVAEFAAVHGVSTGSGRRLIAAALELRDRLPQCWQQVQALRLPAWKGIELAHQTRSLGGQAARFVDSHAGPLGARLGLRTAKRLVLMATARYEPERLQNPDEQRWVRITAEVDTLSGCGWVEGQLDTVDALDLEAAIVAVARDLAADGTDLDLPARRALALGILARTALGQPALPTSPPPTAIATPDGEQSATVHPDPDADAPAGVDAGCGRTVSLYLHLRAGSITDSDCADHAELGTTDQIVTVDQVRRWCGTAGQVLIRPVIDLNTDRSTRAYEPTDLMHEHIALRDRSCVFPHCTRPARPVQKRRRRQSAGLDDQEFGFDADHIVPWQDGGPTDTANLAPLCRQHHRLKTHTAWTYCYVGPGEYLWQSPNEQHFLRTTTGTIALSAINRTRLQEAC